MSKSINATHIFNLRVGIDLTRILAPEAIPGVKAYLGVDDDAELLQAIVQDKYLKMNDALAELDLQLLEGHFERANQSADESPMDSPETINKKIDTEEPKKNHDINEYIIENSHKIRYYYK